jgi:hypothetical protein
MAARCCIPRKRRGDWATADVVAQRIDGAQKKLSGPARCAIFADGSPHLRHLGVLKGVRFDPTSLEVRGAAVTVVDGVRRMSIDRAARPASRRRRTHPPARLHSFRAHPWPDGTDGSTSHCMTARVE